MSYRKSPEPINNIFEKLSNDMATMQKPSGKQFILICRAWQTTMGKHISANTEIEKEQKGTLFIKVINDAWRNELFMRKNKTILLLNTYMKSNIIKDIHFK